MTDNEEAYEEEAHEEERKMSPQNYEITMIGPDTKNREKYTVYGFLGLNPGFVLIQSTESQAMLWASPWEKVWSVRALQDAKVLSMAVN